MQESAEGLTQQLKAQATALGFSRVGVTPATPGKRLAAYEQWLARGYHGEMAYLARPDRLARRQDLQRILPGARTLVCVSLDYATPPLPEALTGDPSRGRISNYAWGLDYHAVMTPRLEALAHWLAQATGGEARSRVYVDTGAILERDQAESAELGFIGKNTLLIQPRRGSYSFLGELLTTAALLPDTPQRVMPSCGHCRRCLDACPTAAFPEPYVLDARRCISYLTIELKGAIPVAWRPLMGNWIYGCDICQTVCPFNRFAEASEEEAFRPKTLDAAAPPLLDVLALDAADFAARYAGSPLRRLVRARFLRNACVAAGNWGHPAAIPALARLLADPEALIRGHAAWALGRIATPESRAFLAAALALGPDTDTRREIFQGLGAA